MTETAYPVYARTYPALVFYLNKELESLGVSGWTETADGVTGEVDDLELYKLIIHSRLALGFYKILHRFPASEPAVLKQAVRRVNWADLLTLRKRYTVKPLFSSGTTVPGEAADAVRDGILDYFREEYQTEPGAGDTHPPLSVCVAIQEDGEVLVMLDAVGEPLWNRGYHHKKSNPADSVMAAGLTRLAGWDTGSILINPMCGDALIAIEAAFIAKNKAPALLRKEYDILHWPYFRSAMWKSTLDDAQRLAGREGFVVEASDSESRQVDVARNNIREARLSKNIHLKKTDPSRIFLPEQRGVVLAHVPTPRDFRAINWRNTEIEALITKMKGVAKGYRLVLFTDDEVLKTKIAFKTQKVVELKYNDADHELLYYQF
jgi:23S rRNA (guanine2445-N2)-methyltransferase / 23S rRNA (guanine2069-N7)-methyltransferase